MEQRTLKYDETHVGLQQFNDLRITEDARQKYSDMYVYDSFIDHITDSSDREINRFMGTNALDRLPAFFSTTIL